MTPRARHDIPLAVVGCDFRVASTVYRERLISTPEERAALVAAMRAMDGSAGLVAVETCNRVEWVVSARDPEWMAGLLHAQMTERLQRAVVGRGDPPSPYVHYGYRAVLHVLRVAAGLESLASGEAQIAGQLQRAFGAAREAGTSSIILNGLAGAAGRVAKAAFRLGFRSNELRGIHGLVICYLAGAFGETTADRTVVVAGMGEIGRKTASVIEQHLRCRVVPVNRTVSERHAAVWRPLSDLPGLLAGADALVVATGGRQPVIGPELLAVSGRDKPLLVMDIGIPRQVDPEAVRQPLVDYRTIDDLVGLERDPENARQAEAVEEEIRAELTRFRRFCYERDMVALLDATRQKREELLWNGIPAAVAAEFPGLEEPERRRLEAVMQRIVRDYSNDVVRSIHTALEEYWRSQ